MQWDCQAEKPTEERANSLVLTPYRSKTRINTPRRPSSIKQLPRISKVKSPIRIIPAGYEDDQKKKRKKVPERQVGTEKHRKPYNTNHQLRIEDYVSGANVAARPARAVSFQARVPRSFFPDLRERFKRPRENRRRSRCRSMAEYRQRGPAYDEQGCHIRGTQFGGLKPIPRDSRIGPPPKHCFKCLTSHCLTSHPNT